MIKPADLNETLLTTARADFNKGLCAYASFKVNNQALSEDLVQDTFIKTWSYLVKGGEILKMKVFLYHVLNGLIIDEYRKHKSSSLDVLQQNGFEPPAHEGKQYADTFDGEQALQLIAELPEPYCTVLKLRFVDDLSLTEIALKVGKSNNTVAVQVHRGLEKLRVRFNSKMYPLMLLVFML
jgi:RNA polymerase sigma-70 factor, ECF subfamily